MTGRSKPAGLAPPRWVEPDEVPLWAGSKMLPGLFMGPTADALSSRAQPLRPGDRPDLMLDGHDPQDAVRLIRERRSP